MISLGGDGTLLDTVHKMGNCDVPVAGGKYRELSGFSLPALLPILMSLLRPLQNGSM